MGPKSGDTLYSSLLSFQACDPPEGPITGHLVVGVVWEAAGPHWFRRQCWSGQGRVQGQHGHCLGLGRHPAGSLQALHVPTLGVWLPGQSLAPPPWKRKWLQQPQLGTPPCRSHWSWALQCPACPGWDPRFPPPGGRKRWGEPLWAQGLPGPARGTPPRQDHWAFLKQQMPRRRHPVSPHPKEWQGVRCGLSSCLLCPHPLGGSLEVFQM